MELKEITVEKMPQMHIWDIRDDIDNLIKNEHCIMYQPMDSFSFNDTALFRASDDEMNDESMLDSILSLDISKQEGSNETLTENKESDSSKQLEAEKEAAKVCVIFSHMMFVQERYN